MADLADNLPDGKNRAAPDRATGEAEVRAMPGGTRPATAGATTSPPGGEALKQQVREFWNAQSCNTEVAKGSKFSRQYFEEIEAYRYLDQPFIHAFAQFTRYHGRKVLEVGFGAGTDFIQWLRAGADASGVDLTPEALEHVGRRIALYGLPPPEKLLVADAEALPFESNTFDLGYSFGVLHHTPDTARSVRELVRVVKPGGDLKIMLYNRRSIFVVNRWLRFALLCGRPWRSLRWILWNRVESAGTKGYTRRELVRMLGGMPLKNLHIHTQMTSGDLLSGSAFAPLNWLYRRAIQLRGYQFGWHPGQGVERVNEPGARSRAYAYVPDPRRPLLTGNALGFYHCIHAQKED